MDVEQAVEVLAAWAERNRLVEEAHAELEGWLESRGGSIGGFSRYEIGAAFHQQSLLFRSDPGPHLPVVVTCLTLTVYGGECPLGTFKLLSGPDGCRGIEVELGAEVPLDELGHQVRRIYE